MNGVLAFLILVLPLVQCGSRKYDLCNYEGDYDAKCNSDGSGYARKRCTELNREKKINVWQTYKETRCDKPTSGCRCFNNNDYEEECECINPRKRPAWPSFGVLRWNGTAYIDDKWYVGGTNPRRAYLPGEIHINGNGQYMKKWTTVAKWPTKGDAILKFYFEVVIPNNDGSSFTKLQGSSNSKNCSKSNVTEGKTFYSMWKKPGFGPGYSLKKETKKMRNVYSQVWSAVYYGDDWKRYWEWRMDYNPEKNYAIPTRYFYEVEDGFNYEYEHEKYDYIFEEIRKDDETFRVNDYCDNV